MSVRASSKAQFNQPSGLVIEARGKNMFVIPDTEITEDIMATIPKLHEAVARGKNGSNWKRLPSEKGVNRFEMVSDADDHDIIYAAIATTELRCHLNEVLSVLINRESGEYESTMRALNGTKFNRGDVMFQRSVNFDSKTRETITINSKGEQGSSQTPQQGVVTVSMATFKPKHRILMKHKHKRAQKLCLSTCSFQYPSKDRAIHVMKTLPKHIHDQIVSSADRTAIRRQLDHIAVGFDIQSTHRPGGSSSQTTRVFAHGYASDTPPSSFGRNTGLTSANSEAMARRREAFINPEAKYVTRLLTDSLKNFERVIRRRRFGFQSFIYFPTETEDAALTKNCSICRKNFSLFRRDFFCQLCGHMACGECSKLYEVEARIGEVRQNRVCVHCVIRVDACKFDDEDLLPALGPIMVDVDVDEWLNDDEFHLDIDVETEQSSVASEEDLDNLTTQLYSQDPATRSYALETLARLVSPTSKSEYQFVDSNAVPKKQKRQPKTLKQKVRQDIENHLSNTLRTAKDSYQPEDFDFSDRTRDYEFSYDAALTKGNPNHPLAPMPSPEREERRLMNIKKAGVLEESFDRSAFDLLAQVAAKRMNCPIGFLSVVDDKHFHAVGTYQLPDVAMKLDRNNNMCMHTVYAEKAFVVKNPQRDMRFAQMPCVQELDVKFYAGFPVYAPDGSLVATLCTADGVAHNHITSKQYATMEALAKLAADMIAPQLK